ncbi:MAG: hypothetical protein IT340_13455 [Chloroflexi bacterium]|nr:hypothetical protein [Chloroflexota bacterium]
MIKSRIAALVMVLFCALFAGSLLVPPSIGAEPPKFQDCRDITFAIRYQDEWGNPQTIWSNPSEKYLVPVLTRLQVHVFIAPDKQGGAVLFRANNPWTAVAPSTVTEGGVVTGQTYLPIPSNKVNFKINWPGAASSDGFINFTSFLTTPGKLATIGATVAGGRCSAKIEVVGRERCDVETKVPSEICQRPF